MKSIFEKTRVLSTVCCTLFTCGVSGAATVNDFAVMLTATVSTEPAEIHLHWPGDPNATGYLISRKLLEDATWTSLATIGGSETWYPDRSVQAGVGYEYQVIKNTAAGYTGYGYIYAGNRIPVKDSRGRVLLIVEQSLATPLRDELERLQYDLIADGWTTERIFVSVQDSVIQVKNFIRASYLRDPANTKALLLLGHVPVPYSGDIAPDEHPNHQGAWPADVYYGDMDGIWTDSTVMSTNAERSTNWNIPGDGKFDQSLIPGRVELQVGRVDLSSLTCFLNKIPARNEVDLTRQYLDKDHKFRTGQFNIRQQALIIDLLGMRSPEPMAAMSWRNSAPLVGEQISSDFTQFYPAVSQNSFLFGFMCGGGGPTYSQTVGSADAFAASDADIVFTTFIGSYFGDWDNESNLLRASLGASGMLLTTCYAGKPSWLFHPLALGECIGLAVKLTQENGSGGLYPPYNPGAGMVHISLLGDPTLRIHPIAPVTNLRGIAAAQTMNLSWSPSSVANLQGYLVYKANSAKGPFQKLTATPIQDSNYQDPFYQPGQTYIVKTVNLTESPSGSYFNTSLGTYYPEPLGSATNFLPGAPVNFFIAQAASSSITLEWLPSSGNPDGFKIEREGPLDQSFVEIASLPSEIRTYTDSNLNTSGVYAYRIRAWNSAGLSPYSDEVQTSTLGATAEFVGSDFATAGQWKNQYGTEGYAFAQRVYNLPPGTTLSLSNLVDYSSGYYTDPRVPSLPDSTNRLLRAWIDNEVGDIDLSFTDNRFHEVSLYSYENVGDNRTFNLQVLDAVTGNLLDSRKFESFTNGVYISYVVKNHVLFRLTAVLSAYNLAVLGLYIDPPRVAVPTFEPSGAVFLGKEDVIVTTSTPDAEIYYTLDGSVPTRKSSRYTGPFTIRSTAVVNARAFRDGFEDSPVSEATFIDLVSSQIGFLNWDNSTGGTWPSKYGKEGYIVPAIANSPANYSELMAQGADTWVWTDNTDSTRALQRGPGFPERVATSWYAPESFTVDLAVLDSRSHAVGFYFLDWDQQGRIERIEFSNDNGTTLQSFDIADFSQGRYLVMNIQGYTHARISRLQGKNAILNGIFFDSSPAPLSQPHPVPLLNAQIANQSFTFSLTGNLGQSVCVDRSFNLKDWNPIQTNIFLSTSLLINVPQNGAQEFYRIHFLP